MNIEWLKDCRITIFTDDNFDQWDITVGLVNKDVCVFGSRLINNREYVDLQFHNGDESYNIPRDCFQEVGVSRIKNVPRIVLEHTAFKLL